MTRPATTRRRGRPRSGSPVLDATVITSTALRLLETHGWSKFSMRALAHAIGSDPMTLYHYFPSKSELLAAMVTQAFTSLDPQRPPFDATQPLEQRLQGLAQAYLEVAFRVPALLAELIAGRINAAEPASRFAALFRQAVADVPIRDDQRRDVEYLLIDYLHGFALGADAATSTHWQHGVRIIVKGIEAMAHPTR